MEFNKSCELMKRGINLKKPQLILLLFVKASISRIILLLKNEIIGKENKIGYFIYSKNDFKKLSINL